MKHNLSYSDIAPIIKLALNEDIGNGDITSNAIFHGNEVSNAIIVSKEDGVFCGGEIIKYIYKQIDSDIEIIMDIEDGNTVYTGDILSRIKGNTKNILIGERTVLNFIQRMSGIASRTSRICSKLSGTKIKILDTRKTMPGLRLLDKYSVKTGGGTNHRFGLYDMVMIKDNHIRAAGGIEEAVNRVKKAYGDKYTIEVETTDIREVKEAISSEVDIVMLDNMNKETLKDALRIIDGKVKIEVSGNVNEDIMDDIIDMNIDYISIGALTHSVKAFDLSMKFL